MICRGKGVELQEFQGSLDVEYVLTTLGLSISHEDGDEILCHCPFTENHKNGDRNPSFSFNKEKLIYQCWICGGGNLITLIRTLRPDLDIEQFLREQASPIVQTMSLREKISKKKIEEPLEPLAYPNSVLAPFAFYHSYLKERGITKEVAKKMQIGYDEAHFGITIPHFFNQKLIGWQTRHLAQINGKYVCPTCNPTKTIPKYTNTPRFRKRETLYNYTNALEHAKQGEKVIVVESPLTVLKLMSEGYGAVVATFGAWSKEQMFSLIGCLNGVYLWPDNDPAGWSNVARVCFFLSEFIPVRIVPAVDKEKGDAADLDQDAVRKYLNNAYSPFKLRKAQHLLTINEVQMAFQKFGDSEKVIALDNSETNVVRSFVEKFGKRVEEFSEEEREELRNSLDKPKN